MLTASGSAFHDKVAVSQKWNQLNLLVWGALAFAVNVVIYALTAEGLPSWIKLLPCTYQVRMVTDEITAVITPFDRIMDAIELVPMLLLIVVVLLEKARELPVRECLEQRVLAPDLLERAR